MDIKAKMDDFKDRYIAARTEAEREAIFDQIRAEMDTDAEGVAKAVLAQITETNERAKEAIIKDQIKDILPVISLSYIAKEYFGKTKEWLYQRVNGNIVNGKPAKFTDEEKQTLNFALKDIAKKLMKISVS
ncbi:DUF5053 domain-containing protein [Alistipes shahii]|jgi:hypothetical protein|uniref:DUF5053 domain-containing protein n=1 Tax=Alistipes shahii TaxID=328814 RepID=UPI002052BA40|nr:MAG TPA: protein of unknown function (DUF5053) [Caudoviricetes sp.]DAN10636.1 MAG TPA: protein of unknown function (DUF5053) [Caudoviricetes sp.]